MKKISKALFIMLFFVFSFGTTYANNSFDRTPGGLEVENPVTYNVTISDIESIPGYENTQTLWCMAVYDFNGNNEYYSETVALTQLNYSFEFTLPLGDYYGAYWQILTTGETECNSSNGATFEDIEGDSSSIIFSVIEGDDCNAGTFNLLGCDASSEISSGVVGGTQDTGEQNWPLLAFIGVPTSFVIGRYVIGIIKSAV